MYGNVDVVVGRFSCIPWRFATSALHALYDVVYVAPMFPGYFFLLLNPIDVLPGSPLQDKPRAADEQKKTSSVFPILKEVLTHEKRIEPFRYLMAQCVVIHADFHAEMATLVGPAVRAYKPADMKS